MAAVRLSITLAKTRHLACGGGTIGASPHQEALSMPRETKAARIIRLAQDGVDYGEIARAVGSTPHSVSTTVSSARNLE